MSEIYTDGPVRRSQRVAESADGVTPRWPRRLEQPVDTIPFGFAALLSEVLPEGGQPAEAADSLHPPVDTEGAATRRGEIGDGQRRLYNLEEPDTDLSKLDPEFRVRLGRVIERMEREYGHRVQVVETLRPQARQDYLYEQGRDRPGPIVTWTRVSKHTHGLAADVLVDGTYDNPEGYARLAQVAEEEGLRTLGPRDPGHLELVVDRSAPGRARIGHAGAHALWMPSLASRGRTASIELVSVARVAEVAEVAEVARVATVAATAVRSVLARQSAPPEVLARGQAPLDGDAAGGEESQSGTGYSGEDGDTVAMPAGLDVAGRTGLDPFADRLRLVSGAGSVERAARLLEIRQAAGLRSPAQVVLRLADADGDPVRIRIGLRGNAVDARIGLSSEAAVERMRTQIGDLVQALGRRGLNAEALEVQLSRSIADIKELVDTVAARTPYSPGSGGEDGSERERDHSGLMANDPRDRRARDNRDPHSFQDQERKERS